MGIKIRMFGAILCEHSQFLGMFAEGRLEHLQLQTTFYGYFANKDET